MSHIHEPADRHVVPQRAASFGMALFLITLAILFFSGMAGYVIIRTAGAGMPEPGAFRGNLANWKLLTSTALVVAASITIHMAVRRIRREQHGPFLRWLMLTNLLAVGFVLVQAPAMWELLQHDTGAGHPTLRDEPRDTRLYALIAFFVLLHAAHVVGGVGYLAYVTRRALRRCYDHENYIGVRHAAAYWHFLDAVWILMFGTFLLLG